MDRTKDIMGYFVDVYRKEYKKAVSEEIIQQILQWCNNLPRKILNYRPLLGCLS